MNNKVYVKPASGCIVNMPERANAQLPEDGARVPRSQFWLRRIKCGDVIEVKSLSRSRGKKETSGGSGSGEKDKD